jgi:hypothetical protein
MELMNFKTINKGCLLGKFDVKITEWGLTIRGCSYFEKEGKRWVGMPSNRIENKDGSIKNFDHVVFDKGTRARFDAACLEKIKNGQYQSKQDQPNTKIPF